MQKRILIIIYHLGFFLFVGCNQTKNELEETTPIPYKKLESESSSIDIPILYSIDNLEDVLNRKIKKQLYNDNSFKNNNNDKLKLKIEKYGRIKIDLTENFLACSIPLKVRLEKKTIGTKKIFGKELFKKGNVVRFAATLFLSSDLAIDHNWKLITNINYNGIKWKETPEVTFLKIDITQMVETQLEKKMPELTQKFDQSIYENLDIKQNIGKVWRDIQKPILINKIGEKVWLQFSPFSITTTPIATKGENIFLQLTVGTYAKTLMGSRPKYTVNKHLPKLSQQKVNPNTFNLNIVCNLSFQSINRVLKSVIVNKEIEVEGEKFKVKAAQVSSKAKKLLFNLSVKGDVSGDIIFEGMPTFNSTTNVLQIKEFDFSVDTEEWLLEFADQVFHDEIKQQITEKLDIPLEQLVKKIPTLISQGIEKGKLKEKLNIHVDSLHLDVKEILITSEDFQFMVNGKGKIGLELEKL